MNKRLRWGWLGVLASVAVAAGATREAVRQGIAAAAAAEAESSDTGQRRVAEGLRLESLDPRVAEVLGPAARLLAGARSASVELVMKIRVEMEGMKQEMPSEYSLAMERPNRFALVLKSGMVGATVVSDGTNAFTYVPLLKQYLKHGAPTSFAGWHLTEAATDPASAGGSTFITDLFTEDVEARILEGVTNAIHLGEETVDGEPCSRLRFFEEEFDWELWVQRSGEPVFRRMRADMSRFMQRVTGQEADAGVMSSMLTNLTLALELEFGRWRINPELPAGRFVFAPPEGTREVEAFGAADAAENEEARHPLVGRPAPNFTLDLLSGGKIELSTLRGQKVVILDFWATWCGPCVRALPILSEVAENYRDRGVVLYALNQEEDEGTIRKFLERWSIKLSVALDRDGAVGDRYEAEGIPQTVIIDRTGTVRYVHVGFARDLKEQLTRELEELLRGSGGTQPRTPAAKP